MQLKRINVNPSNRTTDDCYVRALTIALNIQYREAYKALSEYGLGVSLAMTDSRTLKGFLKSFGYYEKLLQRKCNVATFAEIYAKLDKVYILKIGKNGATVIKNKIIYDSFDISKKVVNGYWIIN